MTDADDKNATEDPDASLEALIDRQVAQWPRLSAEHATQLGNLLGMASHSIDHAGPAKVHNEHDDAVRAPDERVGHLRTWARGDLALEAAVELLIGALDGRLLDGPWILRNARDHWYFHTKHIGSGSGHLSGGERRVLAIAASLADSNRPVDLGVAITGLDPDALRLVLEALEHAGGGSESPEGHERSTHGPR